MVHRWNNTNLIEVMLFEREYDLRHRWPVVGVSCPASLDESPYPSINLRRARERDVTIVNDVLQLPGRVATELIRCAAGQNLAVDISVEETGAKEKSYVVDRAPEGIHIHLLCRRPQSILFSRELLRRLVGERVWDCSWSGQAPEETMDAYVGQTGMPVVVDEDVVLKYDE